MRTIFKAVPRDGYNASASQWETREGGGMATAGMGGPLTGKGFKVGIIDDPLKNNEEAMSAVIRQKHKDWYLSTFLTRAEPDAAIVIIMTRWHDDDLAGWLLKEQPGQWEVINFPAIAEGEDILGRKEGEALWPERYPLPVLQGLKANLGSYWWSAMYQQRPEPEGGGIIKRAWWQYYKVAPPKIFQFFWSWDTASKTGEENDWSVGQLWGIKDNAYYLLKQVRARLEYPDLKRTIIQQFNAHPANGILIEDKSSGQSVIQDLRRDTRLPIIAVEPIKDKVTRAHIASPTIEAGKCFLPEDAPWIADFIDEVAHFPKAAHDDQVDCTTQFINYVTTRPNITASSFKAGLKLQTGDLF
jgi:predicted phage terminase large subunit-like protein